MEFEKDLDIAFSNLEKTLTSNVQDRCTKTLTEVNDAFNKVLENTVSNFEHLEFSITQSIADIKFILINNLLGRSVETVDHLTIDSETAQFVTFDSISPIEILQEEKPKKEPKRKKIKEVIDTHQTKAVEHLTIDSGTFPYLAIDPNCQLEILQENKLNKKQKPDKIKNEAHIHLTKADDKFIKHEHQDEIKSPKMHSCNYCSYTTPRKYRIKHHMKSNHKYEEETLSMKFVRCVYCNWECIARWQLTHHMKTRHPEAKMNENCKTMDAEKQLPT